jgi:hypothetical protein
MAERFHLFLVIRYRMVLEIPLTTAWSHFTVSPMAPCSRARSWAFISFSFAASLLPMVYRFTVK